MTTLLLFLVLAGICGFAFHSIYGKTVRSIPFYLLAAIGGATVGFTLALLFKINWLSLGGGAGLYDPRLRHRLFEPDAKDTVRRVSNDLLDNLYIVDSHQDIAWNVGLGRDFLEPAASWRERVNDGAKYGERLVTLPDLLASQVRLVIGTIFVLPSRAASMFETETPTYSTDAEARQIGFDQLEFYTRLAKEDDRVVMIRTLADLQTHVSNLELGIRQLGIIASMEGADPIVHPSELAEWVEKGLRLIGPAWKGTRYCGGTGEPGP